VQFWTYRNSVDVEVKGEGHSETKYGQKSLGWEGKGRYGSFRWWMNAGCAGKTVRSLENVGHT